VNSISLSTQPPQTVPTDSFSNCQPSLQNILSTCTILKPNAGCGGVLFQNVYVREAIEMNLSFKEEVVGLSIPRGGEILESGWKITPLQDPIVSHHSCLLSQFCCVITHTLLQVETKTCSPVFCTD